MVTSAFFAFHHFFAVFGVVATVFLVSAEEYRRIMMYLRVEMALLLGAALCASLMARGVGL